MKAAGTKVVAFDATTIAQGLGDIRLGNTVMLGAIADHLPFSADDLLACVLRVSRTRARSGRLNRRAFARARRRWHGRSRDCLILVKFAPNQRERQSPFLLF
jgi:indolepyruvate ferredoxin oxidoreductase beta subunit